MIDIQKLVIYPVKGRTGMWAAVQVSVQLLLSANHETLDYLVKPLHRETP